MKITVIGLGYLGATHAVVMAKLGHTVIGIEPNQAKVDDLRSGRIPFFEPGLDEALHQVLAQGNIRFETEHDAESLEADLHFLCVGTPQVAGSKAANTDYLFSAVAEVAKFLREDAVVAGKSTVPVGTAAALTAHLAAELAKHGKHFAPHLAWNPEFLREGNALEDSIAPDRIVLGVTDERSEAVLREAYKPITDAGSPLLVTDIPTAELVKVAANSFLATKISFINAIAEVAEASGADAVKLAEAIGYDDRIGKKFLRNGIGFGGGCLPKDIRGFIARADELGVQSIGNFLGAVDQINLGRRERVVELAKRELGSLAGKSITVLGAAFKPDTDDIRDSPAIDIALKLTEAGANVLVHDPISLPGVRVHYPALTTEDDLTVALTGAELVILATEWKQYRELDPAVIGELVGQKLLIDGRNYLNVDSYKVAGWRVVALGRNVE
jgi:UDPglucose 6-dehydrogenase